MRLENEGLETSVREKLEERNVDSGGRAGEEEDEV